MVIFPLHFAFPMLLASLIGSAATGTEPRQSQDASLPANARARPIVVGMEYGFHSAILQQDRRITVRLPDHYGEKGRRFPVLVLLDGGQNEDFLHIAGLTQITTAYGSGQELILVGIEGIDRRHDLTEPSSNPEDCKAAPTSGGAAIYRDFLTKELRPWIAAHFATNGHAALMGESLAGLFVVQALLRQPHAFDDYIAVSPSLWWDKGRLSSEASAQLRGQKLSQNRLFLALEQPSPPADQAAKERGLQDQLIEALRSSPTGLHWSARRMQESHGSIYHPAALEALRTLFGQVPAHP